MISDKRIKSLSFYNIIPQYNIELIIIQETT